MSETVSKTFYLILFKSGASSGESANSNIIEDPASAKPLDPTFRENVQSLAQDQAFLDTRSIPGHLPEHGHGVEKDFDLLELQLVVDDGDGNALDIDGPAVGLDGDFLTLAKKWQDLASAANSSQSRLSLK